MENENTNSKIIIGKTANMQMEEVTNFKIPTFTTSSNGKYIEWLDSDGKSQWLDKLLEYKSSSALHGRIIREIVRKINGQEFIYDQTLGDKSTRTAEFLSKLNKDGDNLYNVFCKASEDEYTFGPSALILIYERSKASILNVEHISIRQLRATPVCDSQIPGWIWSWDWNARQKSKNWIYIPSNNFIESKKLAVNAESLMSSINDSFEKMKVDNISKSLNKLTEIYGSQNVTVNVHMPTKDTTSFYYPSLPTYIGGLTSIKTDIAIGEFNYNAVANGLNADSVLIVYGMSESDREVFYNDYNDQYRNPSRGKSTIFLFAPDVEHKPDFQQITNSNESLLYTKITNDLTDKILQSHGVTMPSIVGVSKASVFGDSGEALQIGSDLFYENVIQPIRARILKPFNDIMRYNDLCELSIKDFDEKIQTNIQK